MNNPEQTLYDPDTAVWRRRYTKVLAGSTLLLIFLGGQVKSHEAGLAVPDWPTSFGYNMFLFPVHLMQGGIFHEHLHRLVASGVGLLTMILAIWCFFAERRRWVRNLSYVALGAVIVQGVLGGLTVMYMLPDAISIMHGVLAQTFLVLTVFLAYAHSKERHRRVVDGTRVSATPLMAPVLVLAGAVFVQLVLGATMRHFEAGLAIPDFPSTAGRVTPWISPDSVTWVNEWRADRNFESDTFYPPVSFGQLAVHLAHRYGALLVTVAACWVTLRAYRQRDADPGQWDAVLLLDGILFIQVNLGIATVLTLRVPEIASMHVVTGAALLGVSAWLAFRSAPARLRTQSTVSEQTAGPPVAAEGMSS